MKKIVTTPLGLIGLLYFLIGTGLNIWMFVVRAWPTYIFFVAMFVGIVFVALSLFHWNFKFWKVAQTMVGILPIIILYGSSKVNEPSNDLFLIPTGFRGKVIVMYGQEDGTTEEYEDGKRLYRIPQNGLLRTQFKIKGNSIKMGKYYFVNKMGQRTKIELSIYKRETDSINLFVWNGSVGAGENSDEGSFDYQDFTIDKTEIFYSADIFDEIEKRENNPR